jgi:hypothetical protein
MLMRCAWAVQVNLNAVDIFDGTSGRWMTAALSVARGNLAATSLPNQGLAFFAGGNFGTHYILFFWELLILQDGVMWESGGHVLRGRRRALRCWRWMLMRCAWAGGSTNAVDIFDGTSGRWMTAALSVPRGYLAATSLPNQGLAMFAGGGTYCILFWELLI